MYELARKYGPLSVAGSLVNTVVATFLAVFAWRSGVDVEPVPGATLLMITAFALASFGVFVWRVAGRVRSRRKTVPRSEEVADEVASGLDELEEWSAPWKGAPEERGLARSGPWRGRLVTVTSLGDDSWRLRIAADPADADDPESSEYCFDAATVREIAAKWRIRWETEQA